MPKPPTSDHIVINGPAGRLQALFEVPGEQAARGSVLVCHPHPQQGGTMQNKVVHTLARAFLQRGMRSLRFNFRGVGESDGEYDEARGEVDDALAAMAWLRDRFGNEPLWIAGFSFGAAIAIRVAMSESVSGLVSVAPAVYRFTGNMDTQPVCPWLIVHGDADEVVPVSETLEWMNALEPGPELSIFDGTGHYFHGKLVQLREVVDGFVASQQAPA